MVTSTILTLVVIPVIYTLFSRGKSAITESHARSKANSD